MAPITITVDLTDEEVDAYTKAAAYEDHGYGLVHSAEAKINQAIQATRYVPAVGDWVEVTNTEDGNRWGLYIIRFVTDEWVIAGVYASDTVPDAFPRALFRFVKVEA